MIYINKLSIIGMVILGLSACDTSIAEKYAKGIPIENHPIKNGATSSDYDSDLLSCQVDAANKVPAAMKSYTTPTWTTTAYTNCSGYGYGVSCYTSGGDTYGGDLVTTDANEGLRNRVTLQCLSKKGWQWIDIPTCPEGTSQSDLVDALIGKTNSYCYIPASEDTFYSGYLK